MGKFVVLTGLDGSGKDYVASYLHTADPGSMLFQTPTGPFLKARTAVDRLALEASSVHYFFYLASVIHVSAQIGGALQNGNVYCVRYLLDTVAYHRAMGLPVNLEYETPLYRILRPDLTCFLVVDEDTRQHRLVSRHKFTVGDRIVQAEDFRNRLLGEYQRFAGQFVTVANYGRDVRDVVAEIRGHILSAVPQAGTGVSVALQRVDPLKASRRALR